MLFLHHIRLLKLTCFHVNNHRVRWQLDDQDSQHETLWTTKNWTNLKFKSLWKSGYDSHLDIDSLAGQAWVGLHLGKAQEPGHPLANGIESLFKQRCRARGAEERKVKGEKPLNDGVEEEITEAEEAAVAKVLMNRIYVK